jgi:hypothetical protein
MTPTRREILRLIEQLSDRYPDWRLGQMVVNIANWASNPVLPESVWDVEDEQFLAALQGHLERRFDPDTGIRPVATHTSADSDSAASHAPPRC